MARPPVQDWPSRRYRESRAFKTAARTLGLRIRMLRNGKGLTLEKAAEAADLELTHWQKAEAGKLNLTLVTLCRIADGLEQPLEALFSSEPPKVVRESETEGHPRALRRTPGSKR